ncbi:hypothetical protein IWW40_004527 [Coemansia sp. RSA 1250]|nr:hypothetical protein IWW40_004527 [Coemansia sp. RSA 1250]
MSPEDSTQATPGRSKRSRKSANYAVDTSDAEDLSQVKEECLRIYKFIKEMEMNGEMVCIAFNKLPPKKEYPDYYVEIKKPIALDIIKGKITRGVYGSVAEFIADIDLMCNNAQQYNIPDSYIYEIAGEIRKKVHEQVASSSKPHLKLRIRQSESAQSDGQDARPAASSSKARRKRPLYSESDSDGTEESSAGQVSSSASQALDELFQAIYEADLGKATKLLEIPDLPINDYRKVVLKDQEEPENDNFTWAPLHAAACYGRLKVAQVLCRRGAKVEAVDTMHKSTPLAWAAYTGRKRLAKFLVREFKANVNARNAHGQLPIEIAVDPGHPMWSEFLLPTDGTQVDLPPPEVQETTEPRHTPAKKTKTRSYEAPMLPSTPGTATSGSMIGALPDTARSPSLSMSQRSGMQSPALAAAQNQPTPMTPNGPVVPQCIGGIGHQETVHPQMAKAMREIVAQLEDVKDEEGESIIDPFIELPDREEYPEYYEVIHYPMALDLVKKRIDGYRSFDAFNYDMLWIFNNATFFNEPESEIYNSAVSLESTYKRLCREAVQKHQIPFDTAYNDAEDNDGRYVSRITVGDHDLFVGDFFYMRNGNTRRVGMVSRLRVGGPYDRRKFIDGRWLLTPSEVPEVANQPVYPHQLFVGPEFEGLGVRGVQGRCFVLLPNVYARVYPQGFAAQDVYICESIYSPGDESGQPGTFKPITNWAHEFKTPLMKPPAFIPYIVPLTPQKQSVVQWNNVNLLPNLTMTVLNREAAARMQSQSQPRSRQTQSVAQPQAIPQSPSQMVQQLNNANMMTPMRSPGMQQPPQQQQQQQQQQQSQQASALQNSYMQAMQSLLMQQQQNLAKAQAQLNQRKAMINKQVTDQMVAAQQQNPAFMSSPVYQMMIKQQAQLLEQAQQEYNTQAQMLQQTYNQQSQALTHTYQQQQQQQQQQIMQQQQQQQQLLAQQQVHSMSPLVAMQQMTQQQMNSTAGMLPTSPGMSQVAMGSPVARNMAASLMNMSPMQSMALNTNGMVFSGVTLPSSVSMASSPHIGMTRQSSNMSPMPQLPDTTFGATTGVGRPSTPSRAPSGAAINQGSLPSPMQTGNNAQAMMAMLLQQQQQQLRQQQQQSGSQLQQPSTPKPTVTPLSPDVNGQAEQQASTANQSQQMFEQWKKATRVFLTHGNSRIEKGMAFQLTTPNASMFLHLSLQGGDINHAVRIPQASSSVLIRPVPGPFNSAGKSLLTLTANSRPCLPRIIPIDNNVQSSENGISDDAPPSHTSDDADKDDMPAISALTKASNYAYEVPLQMGMNMVEVDVVSSEWLLETASSDGSNDQQVPPGTPASANGQKTHQFLLFLTRQ